MKITINFIVTPNSLGKGFYGRSLNIPGNVDATGGSLEELDSNLETSILNYYAMAMNMKWPMAEEMKAGWEKVYNIDENTLKYLNSEEDLEIIRVSDSKKEELKVYKTSQGIVSPKEEDKVPQGKSSTFDSGMEDRLIAFMNDGTALTKSNIISFLKLGLPKDTTDIDLLNYLKLKLKEAQQFKEIDEMVGKYYEDESDEDGDFDEDSSMGLLSIGEEVASHLGYL